MNKRILIIAGTMFLIGATLLGIGFIIEPNLVSLSNSETINEIIELDSFKNISIDTIATDVQIEYGEKYSVNYALSSKETLKNIEVKNDTFYFETKISGFFGMSFADSYLVLTIPYDTKVDNLNLKTVSGDIEISNINSNTLKIKATSSDIDILGNYQTIDLKSTSGDISFNGLVNEYANINTISSDIELNIDQDIEIDIDGFSKIEWNNKDYGNNFFKSGSEGKVHIKNTSGEIELYTK